MERDRQMRIVIVVFGLWLAAFAASFIGFFFTDATGDGFTRGLNRLGVWLGWQGLALVIAVGLAVYGMSLAKGFKGARRMSLLPLAVELLLVAAGVALVAYAMLADPSSPPNTPPPASAASSPSPVTQPVDSPDASSP